ncbi:PD-(D/E)XK motif protein [Curtobacterium poinsettiae]|uniref:PD-(D/E)XK motif protein n=1 Tax=Curtobacterium poinsettiae TaxID=159612 RepID=UPI0021C7412F|nr:PD-(D/E)XK motif protein [Curtobacterium flaccumfaciens]MCU0114875.1 PD-(D/E)XK motif protein [Curtobacterium flaccumfaciens]
MNSKARLNPKSVTDYFTLDAKTAFVLNYNPRIVMQIDGKHEQLELLVPAVGDEPDVGAFERLSVGRIGKSGTSWYRLVIDASNRHYEAYVFVEAVVDLLKTGVHFRPAISEVIRSFTGLFGSRVLLGENVVTGLIGELKVLEHVARTAGESAAINSWLGPVGEEHDFSFETLDVEVKTTQSEQRVHQISSASQLAASSGRELFLISMQITRAGSAYNGFTLDDAVASLRAQLRAQRTVFDQRLEGLGWLDQNAELYTTRFKLRTQARAYKVDANFPAITPTGLDAAFVEASHIESISYRINTEGLPFVRMPAPLEEFCEMPND